MISSFSKFNEELDMFKKKSKSKSNYDKTLIADHQFDRKRQVIDEYLQNHPYQVYYYPDENTIKTLRLYRLSWFENQDSTFGFIMFFEDHNGKREEYLDISFFKSGDKRVKEIVATPNVRLAWKVLKDDMIGYVNKALRAAGITLADNVVTSLVKVKDLQYIQHFESYTKNN